MFAQGGLGGLMLRLKQDGHGHCQLVGPKGGQHKCTKAEETHQLTYADRFTLWYHLAQLLKQQWCTVLPCVIRHPQ